MLNRLLFAAIVVFWMVMNLLLWQAEYRGQNELGSTVPAALVWSKILTAPDDSGLEIMHRGEKIGYCRWRANVGEAVRAGKIAAPDDEIEGRVKGLSGYTLDFEGNILFAPVGSRVRFDLHGEFDAEHRWREFTARAGLRPQSWQVHGIATDEKMTVSGEDGAEKWERRVAWTDLRDPIKLLGDFSSPLAFALLGPLIGSSGLREVSVSVPWQARNDWLQIGHSQVRVYRLEARLLGRFQAVVIVSRVGEILRVELPNDIALVNDALVNL